MRGSVYIRPRALRYRWGVQQYPHTKVTTQHNVSFPFPRHPFIPMVKHQWVGPVIFGHDFRCIVSYIWQKSHLVPFANRKFLRDSIPLPNFPGLCSCYYSLNIHPRATEVPQKNLDWDFISSIVHVQEVLPTIPTVSPGFDTSLCHVPTLAMSVHTSESIQELTSSQTDLYTHKRPHHFRVYRCELSCSAPLSWSHTSRSRPVDLLPASAQDTDSLVD